MADRIFPNRFQEDPLDSDLVFQGIDWDNFNQRLAESKESKDDKGLKALLEAIGDKKLTHCKQKQALCMLKKIIMKIMIIALNAKRWV